MFRRWWLIAVASIVVGTVAVASGCEAEEEATPTPTATATAAATPSPTPAATATGTPSPAVDSGEGQTAQPLYLALGDSLAVGEGASDPAAKGYVPLFHQFLRSALDKDDLALMNLGDGGDTSGDLIQHGHLAQAVAEIQTRNYDEHADNDVEVVTLHVGGNDLLDLYFPLVLGGTCPDLQASLEKPECVDSLRDTLEDFGENFAAALDELEQADPDLPILTMTLYNPFSGSGFAFDELAEWALEGLEGSPVEEGLNDLIRSIAEQYGVPVADGYTPFEGKSSELMAPDRIHPNDQGYRLLADALVAAYEGTSW